MTHEEVMRLLNKHVQHSHGPESETTRAALSTALTEVLAERDQLLQTRPFDGAAESVLRRFIVQLRDCLKANPEGPHSLSSWQIKTLAELLEYGTAQAAPKPLTDDPLQGAVDWFLQADGEFFCVATVQRTLRIGYNRAKRLCDIAKDRAAAQKETDRG